MDGNPVQVLPLLLYGFWVSKFWRHHGLTVHGKLCKDLCNKHPFKCSRWGPHTFRSYYYGYLYPEIFYAVNRVKNADRK